MAQKVTLTVNGVEFPCGECKIVQFVAADDELIIQIEQAYPDLGLSPENTTDESVRIPSSKGFTPAPSEVVYGFVPEHFDILRKHCRYLQPDGTFAAKDFVGTLHTKPSSKRIETTPYQGGDLAAIEGAIIELAQMLRDFYENPVVAKLVSGPQSAHFAKDPSGMFKAVFSVYYFEATAEKVSEQPTIEKQ